MIEDAFRKWLIRELDDVFEVDDIKKALIDDDRSKELWEYFSIYHRTDLIELVRTQIKAILKKQGL